MINNISFLFGSGITEPCTPKITTDILNPNDELSQFYRQSFEKGIQETSIFGKMFPTIFTYDQVIDITDKLVELSKDYFTIRERQINYEDLFSMCWYLGEYNLNHISNPLISSFVSELQSFLDSKYILTSKYSHKEQLESFCSELSSIIKQTALSNLYSEFFDYSKLNPLIKILKHYNLENFNIFSLNHDIYLENSFVNNGIFYIDGFSFEDNIFENFFIWNASTYQSKSHVNLLKLHGSIDWFLFYKDIANPIYSCSRRIVNPFDSDTQKKLQNRSYSYEPVFITGTANKYILYTNSLFLDLQYYFKEFLSNSQILIISGYGFMDEAINRRIYEWIHTPQRKILFIIDICSKEELFNKIKFIKIHLDNLKNIKFEYYQREKGFAEISGINLVGSAINLLNNIEI